MFELRAISGEFFAIEEEGERMSHSALVYRVPQSPLTGKGKILVCLYVAHVN